MNTWKVILATMVIFAAGVVTGGLLTWRLEQAELRRQHGNRPPQPYTAGGLRFEFLRRVERELNLSAEQRQHIDQLLKESQERTHKLMEPVAPQLRQELQRTRDEFRNALTPEQQTRFDELLKRPPHGRDQRRPQTNALETVPDKLARANSI